MFCFVALHSNLFVVLVYGFGFGLAVNFSSPEFAFAQESQFVGLQLL